MTHICVIKPTTIDLDKGLLPGLCQAIISTNAWILLILTLGTNFSEILSEIHTFSFKKMHLKLLSEKWWQFCPGLYGLKDLADKYTNSEISLPEKLITMLELPLPDGIPYCNYSGILMDTGAFHEKIERLYI